MTHRGGSGHIASWRPGALESILSPLMTPRHVLTGLLAALIGGACGPEPRPASPEPPPPAVERPLVAARAFAPEPASAAAPAPAPAVGLPETVVDRVFFPENEASVGGVVDALDAFAQLALGDEELTLVVIARADETETDPDDLSSRRALAVRSYLVRRGVSEGRIRTRALGVKQPRGGAGEPDPAVANRSVELATEGLPFPSRWVRAILCRCDSL